MKTKKTRWQYHTAELHKAILSGVLVFAMTLATTRAVESASEYIARPEVVDEATGSDD